MHSGSIYSDTAAGRVYRLLRSQPGQWFGGWQITMEIQTTAASTHISEVRDALCKLNLPERIEVEQRGRKWFYRIVPLGQMELIA